MVKKKLNKQSLFFSPARLASQSEAGRQSSKNKNKKKDFDKILNKTFKYAKKIAKDFYFNKWANNPPKCPAFDGEVVNITREGWEHIIDDTSRTKTDVLGRLFVLERAKALLEKVTTFSSKIDKAKKEYWIFDSVIRKVTLRVVVRSINGNPRHFLTVIKKGTVGDVIDKGKQK